jgi:glycosyltransferase involved in cell wall biosynthesis
VKAGDAAFSVIIPTYRRRSSLERVLRGLAVQEWPADRLEVLVVSDGGDDGSAELVRSFRIGCPLRLLEQENRGPAAARNLGLAHAEGPLVLFLDDDVVPSPRLLAEHASAHAASADRVVIGTMVEPPGPLSAWVRWETRTLAEQYAAMIAARWPATPWQFYTGNASVGLGHLRLAGGFDPRYRRAEDIELGFRLERLGLEFVFNPAATGTHIAERSFASWLASAHQYGRNDIVFGKGEERVAAEFRHRHPLTRRLVFWGLHHPAAARRLASRAGVAIRGLDRAGGQRLGHQLCSAVFNLNYWLGVSDELGSRADALALARLGSPPGLLSRARSALPIGARAGRP